MAELCALEPLRGAGARSRTMPQQNERYSLVELMVCVAARQLEDGKTAVIGTGMPLAAAMLAQKTSAPHLIVMFEAGSVAPQLEQLPISWPILARRRTRCCTAAWTRSCRPASGDGGLHFSRRCTD